MSAYLVSGELSDYYALIALVVVLGYVVIVNAWFDRKERRRHRGPRA